MNVGGAGSSKSYSTAQHLLAKFNNEDNKNMLICRKTLPALRITAYKLFKDLVNAYGRNDVFLHNKSERTLINPVNKNMILFNSVDDPAKYQSSEFNYIWMEEGIDFDWEDFQILNLRLRAPSTDGNPNQMFLTLNPSDQFSWINERLIPRDNVDVIHSNYKDNPFLDPAVIQEMEGLADIDEYYYRVYTLGEWASNSHQIFTNWEVTPQFLENGESIYGLDFGYNNPTALTRFSFGFSQREVFVQQVLYERKLDIAQLIDRMNALVPNKKSFIYADPEDPRIIDALYNAGFNIHKADKNVYAGLMYAKSLRLLVSADSIDGIKELRNYKWKTDRNGNTLDEPVKFLDHFCDTVRYACYTHGAKYWTTHEVYIPKVAANKRIKSSITLGY